MFFIKTSNLTSMKRIIVNNFNSELHYIIYCSLQKNVLKPFLIFSWAITNTDRHSCELLHINSDEVVMYYKIIFTDKVGV